MPIYTKRGDEGQTDLFSGERVSKTDPRIEAYGTVDELNCTVGLALSGLPSSERDVTENLKTIQNHLHVICANLANTKEDPDRPRIGDPHVERLEESIDRFQEELPPLQSFLLPGGTEAGAQLHVARSVCRRAERRVIGAVEHGEDEIDPGNVRYLNRLSDLLFVLARLVNVRGGETENAPSYD